jgi:hypothetical protein
VAVNLFPRYRHFHPPLTGQKETRSMNVTYVSTELKASLGDYWVSIPHHEIVARILARKHFGWDLASGNPLLLEAAAYWHVTDAEYRAYMADLCVADPHAASRLQLPPRAPEHPTVFEDIFEAPARVDSEDDRDRAAAGAVHPIFRPILGAMRGARA